MTVAPSTATTIYELIGTNLGPFATVFPYAVHGEVKAYLDLGDGAGAVLLTEGPDYTLTPTLPTLTNGGELTLDASVLAGVGAAWPTDILPGAPTWVNIPTLTLLRDTPDGQPSAFGEMQGFSPEACEAALDALARQLQEHNDRWARSVRDQVNTPGWDVPDETLRKSKYVGFDEFGQWALLSSAGGAKGDKGDTGPAGPTGPAAGAVGSVYSVALAFPGETPEASEPWPDHVFEATVQFAANYAGSYCGKPRTLPAGDLVVAITNQLGTAKGTITFHSDGTFSFSSPGSAVVTFAKGDTLRPTNPASPEGAGAGLCFTLKGVITAI